MCVSCGQILFVGPVPLSFSPRGTVGPNPFVFFTPISATYPLDGGHKAWASWIKIRPYRWNALLRCSTSSVLFDGFYVGGPNVFFGKQCGIKMCQNAGLKHKSAGFVVFGPFKILTNMLCNQIIYYFKMCNEMAYIYQASNDKG